MDKDINKILEVDTLTDAQLPPDVPLVPEKIGGWLILPAIGLVLGCILSVIGIILSFSIASEIASKYKGIFAINLLFDIALTVFLFYVAFRFFGKRRNAPAAMISFIIANIIVSGVLLVISIGAEAEPFMLESGKTLGKGIISAAIWIPYFVVSKRVKKTFVVP